MGSFLTLSSIKNNSGQIMDIETKSKPLGMFFIIEI